MTNELQRDRWGRPLIIPPGGGKPIPYARASGIGKVLEDDTNLAYWRARVVAIGLANRPDLQALVLGHQNHKDQELRNAVEEAFKAGGGEARRNQGTALHKLSELADWDHLPDELKRDLDAYRACLDRHGLVEIESEVFVVHDGWKIAGTFDRLLMAPDGRLAIADIKTGSSVEYGQGSWSCQLAVYANGLKYDPATGERSAVAPVLDCSAGIIIHLPAGEGRCDLYEIDLRPGVEAIERALWVKEWRNRSRRLLTKIAPPADTGTTATAPAPAGGAADYAIDLLNKATYLLDTYHQLCDQDLKTRIVAAWPDGVPGPKRSNEWTLENLDAIAETLTRIERDHATSFTTPDPARLAALPQPRPPVVTITRPEPIDEGRTMDTADIDTVRFMVDELDTNQRNHIATIVKDCATNRHPISMKQQPSARRFAIARALYWTAVHDHLDGGDEERLRAMCAHATGDDKCLDVKVPIGEIVGTLDLGHAEALAALAQQGVTYEIDDAGDIRVAVAA